MNGKLNIIFGFIYFALTAVLGPALLVPKLGDTFKTWGETAQAIDQVRDAATASPQELAPAVTRTFDAVQGSNRLGLLAGGPHAHGNLEAMLNIVAGLVLLVLCIPANFKALLSLMFLLGAVLHSGMLYLGMVLGVQAAMGLTTVGAILIVAALALTGIAAAVGIRKQ
jgi:hypothetical protein